ncbi:hypothetical protein DY000_02039852 [Brassica cretica]|uniref:Uncharacterized protein n=1 Tax=Brassica cretica TaxID=69181 RepID=A0ABQ7B723_BRACR|nr:hypothetical protein DY000_02039852 [Brassica cretica]
MKDVLLCKANFQNNVNDRRVILYLNTCGCGKKYCQENAACTVRNKLKRISLKDTAVEFLVEHRKPQAVSEVFGIESCLHGHIHLNKTLLDGWNISVLDIRFNTGGFKALNRSLNIKAPFTEATLIAPRKCFEKAAEKCHKDSLSSVVGSCSWGKRVDVGTGSQFELLWNKKETGLENDEETDVFSFLQMARPTKSSDAYISSPGFDVTEEDMAEWAESPERDSALEKPSGEENPQSDWEKNPEAESDGSASWGSNAKKNLEAEDGAWGSNANKNPGADAASWGTNSNKNPGADTAGWGSNAKKNPEAESDGSAAAWGSNANKNPEAEPDVAAAWGSSAKKNLEAESDAADAAWGSNANKKPKAESDAAAAAWGSNAKKNPGADAAAWGSKDEMNKEETALVALGSWGKRSLETEPCSAAWGKKSLETEPRAGVWGSRDKKSLETESDPVAWGSIAKQNSETEAGASTWVTRDKGNSKTESDPASWGTLAKKNSQTGTASAPWGQPSPTASDKDTKEDDGNPWVSLKGTNSGEKDGNEASQWGIPTKKYPSASSSQGGWSNGGGGADGKRNRPPRTPGSENNFARMLTATGHRVDMFTSEEQELLSDVEPGMRRLRNIMHHSGYADGEPISDDDKTYVLGQIFNFHPEKESKLGSGLDFITVDKHTTFKKKRDNANRVRNSQGNNTPPGNSSTGEKEPVSNGGEDSETQVVGNGGGDSETQAQPIGDGGEDTETQP